MLLTRPRSTAEYESAARIMDSELKKLSRIVDGLFTLSMADAGQLRLAPEPLYLEEVLEGHAIPHDLLLKDLFSQVSLAVSPEIFRALAIGQ